MSENEWKWKWFEMGSNCLCCKCVHVCAFFENCFFFTIIHTQSIPFFFHFFHWTASRMFQHAMLLWLFEYYKRFLWFFFKLEGKSWNWILYLIMTAHKKLRLKSCWSRFVRKVISSSAFTQFYYVFFNWKSDLLVTVINPH